MKPLNQQTIVITGDIPEGALGIARERQKNVEGYADRVEEEPQ